MTTETAGGLCRAKARWDRKQHGVEVRINFWTTNWKAAPAPTGVLLVEDAANIWVSLATHLSFGVEEDWGKGEIDYDDVSLAITLELHDARGKPVPTTMRVVSLPEKTWRSEAPREHPTERHTLSQSVGGCFQPSVHILLTTDTWTQEIALPNTFPASVTRE